MPQGIVGPALFIIFFNAIVNCSKLLKFVLYADDTNVLLSTKALCENIINAELSNVSQWLNCNALTLNISKSNYIVFHRLHRLGLSFENLNININNVSIKRKKYVKFLGIHFDEHLTWEVHSSHVLKKISRFIPIIYNIRDCLSLNALKMFYNSLIYPNLTYGNSLWGGCTQSRLNPIFVAQKKIVRAICSKPRLFHTAPLFKELNFLDIFQINLYMSCTYTFKSLQRGSEWTVLVNTPHATRAAAALTLVVPPILTAHSRQSGRWIGINTWNTLPPHLRSINLYDSFKFHLKRHIIG